MKNTPTSTERAHAILSPSGAGKWMECAASAYMEMGAEDESSFYAEEGTAAHLLHDYCLAKKVDADSRIGDLIVIRKGRAHWTNVAKQPNDPDRFFTVDDEMASQVQKSLDRIREYAGDDGLIFSEQRLSITHLTGEEDAFGTADAVLMVPRELQVHDLKYGRGTKVDAHMNKQLLIYALAAYEAYQYFEEFDTVRVVIHQPRLNHHPEFVLTVDELLSFGEAVKVKAALAMQIYTGTEETGDHLVAGMHCHDYYCDARTICPALEKLSSEITAEAQLGLLMQSDNTRLGEIAVRIPIAQGYFKEILTKVNTEVLSGREVPGFKLVQGSLGDREWTDEKAVEKELTVRGVTQDKIWTKKIISPAKADALKLGKVVNEALAKLVSRAAGKPTVAPASDKRPAITLAPEDDFENLNKNGETE